MVRRGETERFQAAWMGVRQMVQAANFNRFHREGLSATQFMALNVVPTEGLTLTALARRLNLSPATMTVTVNSLEERGLVARTRNEQDGRKVDIRATAAGAELQNAASQEFHAWIAGVFGEMSRPEREGLLAGLEAMVRLGGEETASRREDDAPRVKRSFRRAGGG